MTAEALEKNRTEYIKAMQEAARTIRNANPSDARRTALKSLNKAGIVTKKGDLTAHYKKNMEK